MKLENLSIEWFSLVMNAMLSEGAENCDMTFVTVSNDKTSPVDLCGYGDEDDILEHGMYFLVWDTLDKNDMRWSKLYGVLNGEHFPNECYDILMPCQDNDDGCVLIFKLSDMEWQL